MYKKDQYLKELEIIKNRVFSKQNNRRAKENQLLIVSNKKQNQCYQDCYGLEGINTYNQAEMKKAVKIDPYELAKELQRRKPLQSKNNKHNIMQERVKQLQNMSQKIKKVLSIKRQPSQHRKSVNQASIRKISNLQSQMPQQVKKYQKQNYKSKFTFNMDTNSSSKPFNKLKNDGNYMPIENIKQNKNEIPLKYHQNFKQQYKLPDMFLREYESYNPRMENDIMAPKLVHKQSKQQYNLIPLSLKTQNSQSNETSNISFNQKNKYQIKEITQLFEPFGEHHEQSKLQAFSYQNNHNFIYDDKSNKQILEPTSQTNKLINILLLQIQFQISLRNLKQKFSELKNKNKEEQLKKVLGLMNICVSSAQLLQQLKIQEEEFDPFIEQDDISSYSFEKLVKCMMAARSNWENKVKKSVKMTQLKKQNFSFKSECFNANEIIRLQDIVCYMNLKTNNFFRNRDLFHLFKRCLILQANPKENTLKMSTLMALMSQQ